MKIVVLEIIKEKRPTNNVNYSDIKRQLHFGNFTKVMTSSDGYYHSLDFAIETVIIYSMYN